MQFSRLIYILHLWHETLNTACCRNLLWRECYEESAMKLISSI